MPLFYATLLAALFAGPGVSLPGVPTARWGGSGHRVISRVAMGMLTPPVLEEVRRLLDGQTIVDVSTWADQIRTERPTTAPWHYVDIPITDTSYDAARLCPDGNCVVGALDRQMSILGDRSRPDAERSEALKFVVHLIEDLHQPLHAGDRGDRGGNDVKLTFLGTQTNLHAVWDNGLLASVEPDEEQLVVNLRQMIAARTDLARVGSGGPKEWAMQSHDVSRDVVYRFLPQSLDLGREYVDSTRQAMVRQMFRASVRLAAVLNRKLGS